MIEALNITPLFQYRNCFVIESSGKKPKGSEGKIMQDTYSDWPMYVADIQAGLGRPITLSDLWPDCPCPAIGLGFTIEPGWEPNFVLTVTGRNYKKTQQNHPKAKR